MKRNIFIDSSLEAKFRKEGYVLLPAIEREKLVGLKQFFSENNDQDLSGFQSSHFLGDRSLKKSIHLEIVKAYEELLNRNIVDFQTVFGNFMVKYPGENSRMPLHADWTYVNEDEALSLGVWSPLVDTNDSNGKLGVIPKSHLFRKHKRGPQIPSLFNAHNQYLMDNYGKVLSIKAGEVLVYDHRLLHYSSANKSEKIRPAINLVLCPKKSTIYHFAKHKTNDSVRMYEVEDADFFINYEHFQIPDNVTKTKDIALNSEEFSKEEIDQLLGGKQTFSVLNYLKEAFQRFKNPS